jgi:hypothetical protein
MTVDGAVAMIAAWFGVEASHLDCRHYDVSVKHVLACAFIKCGEQMLNRMVNDALDVVRQALVEAVKNKRIAPSDAVDMYCDCTGLNGSGVVVDYASEYCEYEPYFAAAEEIDDHYHGKDMSEVIAFIDEARKQAKAANQLF